MTGNSTKWKHAPGSDHGAISKMVSARLSSYKLFTPVHVSMLLPLPSDLETISPPSTKANSKDTANGDPIHLLSHPIIKTVHDLPRGLYLVVKKFKKRDF